MALRYGDRQQKMLFPASIEEYIEPEAPERAYDAFIEALDFEALLTECEQADQAEQDQGSLVRMKKELKDQEVLKAQVLSVLEQLQAEQKTSLNTTDADCVRIHGLQGSHAGYNSQIVVDDQHGMIVHSEVVSANNDLGQFSDQI